MTTTEKAPPRLKARYRAEIKDVMARGAQIICQNGFQRIARMI